MKENKVKKKHKPLKVLTISLLSVLGAAVLTIGGYVIYVAAQYSRIPDNQQLEVRGFAENEVELKKELKLTTLNVGFGAYSYDFDFFMDRGVNGYDENGNQIISHGHHSVGKSKEEVQRNTTGMANLLADLDSDFYSLQEVDIESNRAQFVNQKEEFYQKFVSKKYAETFALNFHTAYFVYPIHEPIGASTSGLQTLSRYKITNSVRKSYTVDDSFPTKLFDLDRCFSANYINIKNSNHQLVLINNHMSAYDEGGVIRNQQIKELNQFMSSETEKGNYVIVGGDFNHDLLTNNPMYKDKYYRNPGQKFEEGKYPFEGQFTQYRPDWVSEMFDENKKCKFDEQFTVYAGDNVPTSRGVDEPFKYGRTYICVVDGFLVSDNIEVVGNVVNSPVSSVYSNYFSYSDHQPATITFKLK